MVTRAGIELDWSTFPESDGEPMAETLDNAVQMVDLQMIHYPYRANPPVEGR